MRHSNLGETALGELSGPVTPRVRDVASLLNRGGLPCAPTDNALGHVWSKFVLNCAINPISALTGFRPGQIARDPAASALLERVLDEILRVVDTKKIALPNEDTRAAVLDLCWARYNKPSMLQHVERGRRTEIEALNGALVREAHRLGVPVPANEMVVLAIRAIEVQRRRAPGEQTIDETELEAVAARTPRVRVAQGFTD